MMCRAAQDGQVMMESSEKMWSTGEGKGQSLQYSYLEQYEPHGHSVDMRHLTEHAFFVIHM